MDPKSEKYGCEQCLRLQFPLPRQAERYINISGATLEASFDAIIKTNTS